MKTAPQVPVAHTSREPFHLSRYDFGVRKEDVRLIVTGIVLILAVALPIGYGAGFLVSPRMPQVNVLDAVIDIAQIVLFEEILFRALLFGALYNRFGFLPAVVMGSLVFGALHLIQFPWPMAAMATWAGVVFAVVYERTRRLSTSALTHACIIVIQFLVLP